MNKSHIDTYIDTLRNTESRNSLYIAIEMKRLSLNSEGAFLTTMQSRIPQTRNSTSTENKQITLDILNILMKFNSIKERTKSSL